MKILKKQKNYEDLSREQQKDVKTAYKAFIKSRQKMHKALKNMNYAMYQFNKAKRKYYNKKSDADCKVEKAKKRFKATSKTFYVALKEVYNTWKLFCDKKGL